MNTVKGYRIYINQDNELLPSNTFFDVVGYINNELYTDGDIIRADDETSQYYLVIYYEEDYFAIECLPYSGFNPKNKIIDFSEVRWLTDTNLGDFPKIKIVYDFGLYQTRGVELIDTLPEEVLQSFRDCIYASYYEFDQTIQDDKIFRVQYKLVDNKNYVKSLFDKINIDSIFEQTKFLHLKLIPTQENTQLILIQESSILISKPNSQDYLQNQVSTNGLDIDITLNDILDVGTYNIIIPQQSVFLFGPNGQVEYNEDYIIEFSVVQSGNDQNHEITLYNKLLKIQNNSLNINNFVKRLLGTDTIIIKKDSNYNITLKPILCKTTQGSVSEDVPITDVNTVLLTYSFYQDEVLISHNVQIQYNQDLDLLDIIQDLNVDYIKILVQFNYKQTLIQQGFELYFVNADIYQYITTNQEYVLEGSIDMSNGQPAVTRCGCLLLTNRYDVYETFETIENEQTVIKGVADIVPNTKVRMGNLTGIHNYKFGTNQPRGYGLYGESVYLTGNFYLNNGRSLVDIDRDILFANGNIKEVQRLIESLDNSIRATIEANSTMVEANYLGAISTNNNALLRLGLDYSLWALGNAGIVLMNPNATYNADGEVEPSTVGDGDEAILMQGDSIKFTNYKTKELTVNNVTATYKEVICSNVSPTGWQYNSSIYQPSDGNNLVEFYLGYILDYPTTKNHIDRLENQSSQEYLKYVGFTDISGQTGCITDTGTFTSSPNPKEYYLFNSYYVLPSSGTVYDKDGNVISHSGKEVFILPRVVIAGMFKNGKFNSDFIETENLIAFQKSSDYRKNPNFDITAPITDEGSNPNFPVLNVNNNSLAKDVPFAVISGTTGKITAQGMQMREATIGKESGKHIKITDNTGIKVTPDYFNNNAGTASVPESEPAVYLRDGEDIIAEFSSKKGKQLEKFFKNTSTSIVGSGNSSFNLGTASGSTNSAVITYNRNLTVANATTNSNGWQNKTILGQFSGNNGIVNVAFLYHHTTTTSEQNPNGDTYWFYDQQNEAWSCPEYFAANIDVYKMTSNMYDRFIPTKTSYEYIGDSDQSTSVYALINSDIGRVQYTTEDSLTFEKVIKTGIELTSDNIYEIQGNFMATISQFSELISSQKKEVHSFLTNNSLTGLISNAVDNEGNPINVTGLNNNITGMFTLTLSFGLYNGETLIKTLKSIKYSESCSKIYINNDNFNFKNYLNENDIYNIDEDSVETSKADVISEIKRSISNEFSNSSIRFSGLIKPNQDYNNLTLKATLKVNLAIDTKMSEYSFTKSHNNNDYSSIIDSDIIGSWDVYRRTYGDSDVHTYSEVTPNNDRYYWHPLLSPEIYTIKPKVRVTNCSINLIKVKERTAIQGNGFLTGYEEDNKFEVSFVEKSNQVQFRKSEFAGGIGEILNNSGIYNAFRLNNQEYTINKMIPILYGTFYPDAGTINIQGTGDYSEVSYPASKSRYHYYNFSGYSLFSATDSELGITNTYRIFTNVFKPITNISNINGFGYLHYDPKYDLYICNGNSNGQIVILFGNNWNNLFSRYGKHIILSLVPKYYLYTYTYAFTQTTFTAYKPIVVNNSGIYNSVDLTYKKILSYTKNGRMYTLNFGNEITQSNLFGFEVDCWALDMSINSDNHDILNSVLGYFDIIVNYIPDLS